MMNESLSEFELIEKYFLKESLVRPNVAIGIGDDAAVLNIPPDHQLVVSIDTLVEGVHFFKHLDAADLGYKSMAVSLSDIAAMGADPTWVTLALTMPSVDEAWLEKFCSGAFELLEKYGISLVGGDVTCGPLTVSVQSHGTVPKGKALKRSGAQSGDHIFVTGNIGDAGLALKLLSEEIEVTDDEINNVLKKLIRPEPKIEAGLALRDIATACIDISDGLAADLGHILENSNMGARLIVEDLPLSHALKNSLSLKEAQLLALSSGDDYELCFTVPADNVRLLDDKFVCIGRIEKSLGLRCVTGDNEILDIGEGGYRHFW